MELGNPNLPEPDVATRSSLIAEQQKVNREMTIPEILHSIKTKVEPGRPIPPQFDSSPWRVPASKHPKAAVINEILSESMRVQSSTLPNSGDFEEFIISNASLAVSGLLKGYLRDVLGEDVASLVFGILRWDPEAREGENDYEGTPHLWLEVAGCPVDNTYVELPKSDLFNLEYFYKAKSFNSYLRDDPFKTKMKLYLGQEDTLTDSVKHNFRVFRDFGTDLNVEKYLALALSMNDLNPCVMMFDILMKDWIKERFGVTVKDIQTEWREKCWQCMNKGPEMKTCTKCKLAKYCGVACQQAEWKVHKLLHKEVDIAKEILERNAIEEEEEE